MTSSIISNLHGYQPATQPQQIYYSPYCTLQWRRRQLLVQFPKTLKQPYLLSLDDDHSLIDRLKYSPVNIVRIDPKLDEAKLKLWVDACKQASKPIYLRIPTSKNQPKSNGSLLMCLKRLTDWLIALVILLAVSPLMLGLLLLIRCDSPGAVLEREWHVGQRGKLFRTFQFRTTSVDANSYNQCQLTPIGRWMLKYGLRNLPLLLNVVRGEMSLVGPRCWTLTEALRLNSEAQRQLNQRPGITGSWQIETESKPLHLDSQAL